MSTGFSFYISSVFSTYFHRVFHCLFCFLKPLCLQAVVSPVSLFSVFFTVSSVFLPSLCVCGQLLPDGEAHQDDDHEKGKEKESTGTSHTDSGTGNQFFQYLNILTVF